MPSERDTLLVEVMGIPMSESVLALAEALPAHVTTPDAIHLASALSMGASTVLVTHDAALKLAAEAMGSAWIDPTSPEAGAT